MSPATLHRRFRATTGMSPLRIQKHLRLQEAPRRLRSPRRSDTSAPPSSTASTAAPMGCLPVRTPPGCAPGSPRPGRRRCWSTGRGTKP
ncbi:hypothetical protein ABZ471_34215 [Streptomyces sp. NPDC005728]|uniref:helix-turn-helix domain-containing protein n=1 Tax=Streptomyces sp. NPDC005728 TaxID=3157054 RepID=UPI0033E5F532